jgi:O-antigen/teichoic acid export membrane protein
MCLILFRDGGLLGVGLVHGLGDCLELALQAIFARRLRVPGYAPAADDGRLAELRKDLFHYTRDMLLNSVGNTFRTQVGPMVIGKLRGAAEVSIYSVSTRILGILHDVTNAMFGGIVLTAFGQLHGAEDKERLNREFNRVTTITAGFGAWAVGGLVLFGDAFIHRWLGDSFAASCSILLILAVPHALSIMQYPAYNLLFTIGGQRGLLWLGFIGGFIAGILSLLFGRAWGTQGVAMALATEGLIGSAIGVPWLLHHYCKINPLRYLAVSILWPGLKALVLPVTCAWLLRSQIVPDYGHLVLCGVAYSLVFVLSAPWLLMDAEGRRLISRAFTSR